MASSLNPNAAIYVPTRTNYYLPCASTFTNPNPNFSTYNFLHPFYVEYFQALYQTNLVYAFSPQPLVYYNYTIPCTDFTFVSQQFLPIPLPLQNKCSIEEIDEKFEAEGKTEIEDTRGALVRSRWVLRNKSRMNRRRRSSKVRRAHLEIKCEEDFDERTTVMIKNIPPKITKRHLLSMLDEECVKLNQHGETSVEFDFFYLPIDFNTDGNYGYALVNFTSSSAVRKIYNAFQGHRWDYLGSDKIVKVNYAHVQGLGMLVSRAKGLKLRRRTQIPDSYMPSLFVPPRNGLRKSVEHLLGNRILI